MLSYSDLLISPGADSSQSYLCGYPLKAAQRFIFARTWLGGEGLRPGSVWTHSLILDFPALTLIDDLADLMKLFRRPSDGDFSHYQKAIDYSEARYHASERNANDAGDRVQSALWQLYGASAQRTIVLPSDGASNEILAVALWSQMWPALRRRFAFLTGSATRAPKFDAECSLHFQRGCLEDFASAASDGFEEGFQALARDLLARGPTDLRAFIGRYAIEAKRPREIVPALALLHDIELREPLTVKLEKIRALKETSDLPRLIRDTIVDGLRQALHEEDLFALVEEYRNQPAPKNLENSIAPLAERNDVDKVGLLIATQPTREGELGALIFDSVTKGAPVQTLIEAAERGIERKALLNVRPELWTISNFWPKSDEARVAFAREVGRAPTMADILSLFESNIGLGVADIALQDTNATLQNGLDLLDRVVPQAASTVAEKAILNSKWIETFGSHPELVSTRQCRILCNALIQRGAEFSFPECWMALILHQFAHGDGQFETPFLTVGFATSLNIPAQRALKIAKLTYDPLVKAVRAHKLSREEEHFLSANFPSSHYRTLRHMLAAGVVEKWHTTGINPQALSISSDVEALRDIVDLLVIRFGHSKFEVALRGKTIEPATLALLANVYQPKPKKKKKEKQKQKAVWWWWGW